MENGYSAILDTILWATTFDITAVVLIRMTANSSPPYRATTSTARTLSSIIFETV